MFCCCKCGKEYDDEEFVVKKNKKKNEYTCVDCFDDPDMFYWIKLYEEICIIANIDKLNIRQITQLKRLKKEEKLTFAGMYYCIGYMQLIGKEASEEYDTIGLIPYYYDESTRFWKNKWRLEDVAQNKDIVNTQNVITTKVEFKKEKKKEELDFNFLQEEGDGGNHVKQ